MAGSYQQTHINICNMDIAAATKAHEMDETLADDCKQQCRDRSTWYHAVQTLQSLRKNETSEDLQQEHKEVDGE